MTEKLYDNDSYIKEFSAKVVSCKESDDGFCIELDKTAFFPEGGGRKADSGTIAAANVFDVQIKNGRIFHKTDTPLAVGETVIAKIDWDTRFLRMQNHSGEHIISGLVNKYYGYNNVGFHLGDEFVTLDFDGKLTAEQTEIIEDAANRAVWDNREIRVFFPIPEEAKVINYRSKLEITEGLRLVEIEGIDLCACCAPHVLRTGEIGIIKIISSMPHRGGTRLEIVCGGLALRDYKAKMKSNCEIMKLLSAPEDGTAAAVEKLIGDYDNERYVNRGLRDKIALMSIEIKKVGKVTAGYIGGSDFDSLRTCINSMIKEGGLCVVFSDDGEGSIYIIASETEEVGELNGFLRRELSAKGGGKAKYAQGKIPCCCDEIYKVLERF